MQFYIGSLQRRRPRAVAAARRHVHGVYVEKKGLTALCQRGAVGAQTSLCPARAQYTRVRYFFFCSLLADVSRAIDDDDDATTRESGDISRLRGTTRRGDRRTHAFLFKARTRSRVYSRSIAIQVGRARENPRRQTCPLIVALSLSPSRLLR